ncbi:MAG: hypothetical protein IRZ33_06615 [Alicyclobacillaceae bacterium]|nr:hypothetical protein [Alicyclobacillaceae bacterium]
MAQALPAGAYLRFTRQLMRSAEWLKRYSEIFLAPSLGQGGDSANEEGTTLGRPRERNARRDRARGMACGGT